jgi:phage host-nuclease inhibitor protein Gam
MSSNRIRLSKPVVATRADAETLLGEIAADTANLNALKAALDSEVTAVRQKFEGKIDALAKQLEQKSGLLQQWAEASPEEFGEKRSIEFLHGRIGFRTGNPKLKTIAGWTFDRVLSVIDSAWVRIKKELDKEGLLAAHARGSLSDPELRSNGLRVVQDDTFFVEPKLEEVANT